MINKNKISTAKYIKRLYDWLAHINRCFVSGAFVIEDNRGELYELLKLNSNSFPGLTHKAFKKDRFKYAEGNIRGYQRDKRIVNTKEEAIDVFGSDVKCNENDCDPEIGTMFCLKCKKDGIVQINEEGDKIQECKGIVKFYQFILDKKDKRNKDKIWNKKKFVYLKLEKFLTTSLKEYKKHLDEKVERSKQESQGSERKISPTRREDCKKNSKDGKECNTSSCCKKSKWENDKFLAKWLGCCNERQCQKILKTQKQYNEEYRVGDEFFIPQDVNDSILSNDISEQLKSSCSNEKTTDKYRNEVKKVECESILYEHDCLDEGCFWNKKCMKHKKDLLEQLEEFREKVCSNQKDSKMCKSINYCDLKDKSFTSSKKVCVKKQYGGKIKKVNKRSKKRSKINKK